MTPEALEVMKAYSWPGIVRELRNTLAGLIALSLREQIEASDLPAHVLVHTESQVLIRPGMKMSETEKEPIRSYNTQTGIAARPPKPSTSASEREIKELKLDDLG